MRRIDRVTFWRCGVVDCRCERVWCSAMSQRRNLYWSHQRLQMLLSGRVQRSQLSAMCVRCFLPLIFIFVIIVIVFTVVFSSYSTPMADGRLLTTHNKVHWNFVRGCNITIDKSYAPSLPRFCSRRKTHLFCCRLLWPLTFVVHLKLVRQYLTL